MTARGRRERSGDWQTGQTGAVGHRFVLKFLDEGHGGTRRGSDLCVSRFCSRRDVLLMAQVTRTVGDPAAVLGGSGGVWGV